MSTPTRSREYLLNKVPEITIYFWIIKVLCTTVGETVADFLNVDLGLGLSATSILMAAILAVILWYQFKAQQYVPALYWSAVVMISVVGTLITDNLVDNLGVPLEVTTAVCGIALAAVFAAWYSSERTLSVHSIITRRRETFYWLAILATFALGTAAGDLASERLSLGYSLAAVVFASLIAAVVVARFAFRIDAVLAFWLAYILTRPLGASVGDYLTEGPDLGGIGLGDIVTSGAFLGVILAIVIFLTVTRKDVIRVERD